MATAASRLSNAWVRAGAAAVAVVVVALLALGLTALVEGSGDDREAVVRYIEDVNEIVREQAQEVDRLRFVYARVRANPEELLELRDRLADGRVALVALAARVRALEPPPAALELHRRLLRLLDGQAALAGEVVALASFLPAVAARERELLSAARRLRRGLAETAPAAQAEAFAAYAASVDRAAEGIAEADAPTALVASQRAKVARLRAIARASRELASALEVGEREDVVTAAERFAKATSASTAAVEREAALAYNREVVRLSKLTEAVEDERLRLQRTVA